MFPMLDHGVLIGQEEGLVLHENLVMESMRNLDRSWMTRVKPTGRRNETIEAIHGKSIIGVNEL